jgi:sugar transferase EpsL
MNIVSLNESSNLSQQIELDRARHLSLGIKSIVDRSVALVALLLLSPVLLVVAIAIYLQIGAPIVFCQLRPGKQERLFAFYKFRTMTSACGADGRLLPDADRMTPIGEFLRRTSLDELPQLWNVVRGDMSIVGPRPLLVRYLNRYSPEQAQRHGVKPGITGLAQVRGRNSLSWEKRFENDVWYIQNWSLWLDCQILMETVLKVIRKEGISQEGYATCEEFIGTIQGTD